MRKPTLHRPNTGPFAPCSSMRHHGAIVPSRLSQTPAGLNEWAGETTTGASLARHKNVPQKLVENRFDPHITTVPVESDASTTVTGMEQSRRTSTPPSRAVFSYQRQRAVHQRSPPLVVPRPASGRMTSCSCLEREGSRYAFPLFATFK